MKKLLTLLAATAIITGTIMFADSCSKEGAKKSKLYVSPSALSFDHNLNGLVTIEITTDAGEWDAVCNESWIELGFAEGRDCFTVRAEDNKGNRPRTAIITISAYGAQPVIIRVEQESGEAALLGGYTVTAVPAGIGPGASTGPTTWECIIREDAAGSGLLEATDFAGSEVPLLIDFSATDDIFIDSKVIIAAIDGKSVMQCAYYIGEKGEYVITPFGYELIWNGKTGTLTYKSETYNGRLLTFGMLMTHAGDTTPLTDGYTEFLFTKK